MKALYDQPNYKNFEKERQIDLKNKINENGILVPNGNPYYISTNSEVILMVNKAKDDMEKRMRSQNNSPEQSLNFLKKFQTIQRIDKNQSSFLMKDQITTNRGTRADKSDNLNVDIKGFQSTDRQFKSIDTSNMNILAKQSPTRNVLQVSKDTLQASQISSQMNIFPGNNFESLNSISTKQSILKRKKFDIDNQNTQKDNNFKAQLINKSIDLGNLERLCRKQGPFAFRREGKIREMANMTDLSNNKLELELLNTMEKANRHDRYIFQNQSMSREGTRFLSGKPPNMKEINRQSMEIQKKNSLDEYKPRSLFGSVMDTLQVSNLPEIKPLLKKRIDDELIYGKERSPRDPSLIIQNHSITQRYLTRNVFQTNRLPPKESIKECLLNLRKIQYTELNIQEKSRETERMQEELQNQISNLQEAKQFMEEDKMRLKKKIHEDSQKDTEIQQKLLQQTAFRIQLSQQIDKLNEQINDADRKEKNIEEQLQNEYLNKKFFQELRQSFPLKNEEQVQQEPQQVEILENKTFITEKQEKAKPKYGLVINTDLKTSFKQSKNVSKEEQKVEVQKVKEDKDSPEYLMKGMNKEQFYRIIRQLEEENLFMIKLINEEQEMLDGQREKLKVKMQEQEVYLEKIKKESKISEEELLEQRNKYNVLKDIFNSIKVSTEVQESSPQKKTEFEKTDSQSLQSFSAMTSKKTERSKREDGKSQEDLMKDLISIIEKIYHRVSGTFKTDDKKSFRISDQQTNLLSQLIFIEKRLHYLIEVRDYLTSNMRYNEFVRGGYGQMVLAPDRYQKALRVFEMEKEIEKDNKTKRQLKQIQEEQQMIQDKKRKQDEKIKAHGGGSTQEEVFMNLFKKKLTKQNLRSSKPSIRKIKEETGIKFSELEIDYQYYVEGMNMEELKKLKKKN